MSTNLNPLSASYGPIYGSFFFGAILTTAFYGVTCMQTFFYYVHYPNDPLHLKILVATLWVLDTIHEALSISGVYKYIMAGLLNPLSIGIGNPDLVLVYLLTSLVAIPTQSFFVYRLYIFSGKNIIAPIIWAVLALAPLVCITVYVGKALYSANGLVYFYLLDYNPLIQASYTFSVYTSSTSVISVAVYIWYGYALSLDPNGDLNIQAGQVLGYVCLSVGAGLDILIAIFMTFLLYRERAGTGFARTAHILQRLTVFAVNTGIWTATFALLTIILLHLFPDEVFYVLFVIPLCSIYCNTLLANLNARTYLQGAIMTQNVDKDLSGAGLSLRVSNSLDERHGQVNLASSAPQRVWKNYRSGDVPGR